MVPRVPWKIIFCRDSGKFNMDKPIRVLDIITTAQGGKRLLENRTALINQDKAFINYLACPEDVFFTGEFAARGIPFEPFPMSRGLGPLSIAGEIKRFLALLKRLDVDIVHAHTSKAGAVARLGCAIHNLGRKKRVYITYQVHSFYFNTLKGFKRLLFLGFEIFLSRLSDSLLFQNNHEMEQGRRYAMDKRALLLNIGNGINLREFTSARQVRSLPEWVRQDPPRYITERPFVIICIARVEPKKNHPMLIDAAALLCKKLADLYGEEAAAGAFKIICVGEIGEQWIPAYAQERGLEPVVDFAGVKNRAEVASLLEKSDLSVLTSTAEGKPRALMESMNMGIPCVATDVYGTRDVIEHGKTGFLVPLNDTEEFTRCVMRLMGDPVLYRNFSERSIEKAKREFDEDAVIERLKTLYREKPVQKNRGSLGNSAF
jgi:glycosyltransferase involved in cell wall biosynthesis